VPHWRRLTDAWLNKQLPALVEHILLPDFPRLMFPAGASLLEFAEQLQK
jgi:hypothetical protein